LSNTKTIWARDMGPKQNQQLLDSFRDRTVWILYADEKPPRLDRYTKDFQGFDSK